MSLSFRARRAVKAAKLFGFVFTNPYHRLAKVVRLVLLPLRRPFLFAANLLAEIGVLFDRLSLLAVKAEGYFLKLEHSRLKDVNKP